jgi:hypothetical protein
MAFFIAFVCTLIASVASLFAVQHLMHQAPGSTAGGVLIGVVVFFGITAIVQPILLALQQSNKRM